MKVTPIKKYREPSYPTIAEIGSADLSRVPTRWQKLKTVATSLGAAAMTLKAISLEAAEATKPVAMPPVTVAPTTDQPAEQARCPVTEVCPLPPTKLAGDGRGAFGCVAINPPIMLPEGEALDIIVAEFKKRGIELSDDGVELKGVKAPPRGKEAEKYKCTIDDLKKSDKKFRVSYSSTSKGALLPLVKRNWRADLGTKDGKIVVEYVSDNDEGVWNKSRLSEADNFYCSVSACDIRGAAERVVEGVSARTEGAPLTVGVFYDPMASLPMAKKADGSIDWESENKKPKLSWEEREAKCKELAVEQLKNQIEAFFTYLAKKNTQNASPEK